LRNSEWIPHSSFRIPHSNCPHTTEAIVIGNHDLAEADRIVVFFTKTSGKVRAVAEGVRRIRSKFGGSVQLFSQGRLVYFERPNKTLHKVNEFAPVRPHQLLREDLDRIALASTAVEAVALGVEENEPSPGLYESLAEVLDELETAARPGVVLQGFLLHLLGLLGYRPEFSECVRCRPAPPAPRRTSSVPGGLVCASCRAGATDAFFVSPEALGFLRGAGGTALRLMDRIALSPTTVREVTEALHAFLRQVLGRPLRSADFLGRL
jgi:DNA repair protein RecO (recombination protein O)